MKNLSIIVAALAFLFVNCSPANSTKNNEDPKSFYDFKVKSISGDEVDLSLYKGKKVLIVNVASKCGFTKQYEELQKLHQMYGNKLVILGFPANNFGSQEPGTNAEIEDFCQKNYGVTFPMFEKISVKGEDKHPLYQWLSEKEQNGWNEQEPSWNFCKYLVDETGKLVKFFPSKVAPLDKELIDAINS